MFQSANCDGVVGDAARHAGEAEEVLREEQHVHEDRGQPEVQLAELLVVHVAGPLRQPVVDARR